MYGVTSIFDNAKIHFKEVKENHIEFFHNI